MSIPRPAAALAACLTLGAAALGAQPLDSAYTAQIRALTPTDPRWKFSTDLVDHLPASATIPTPLAALGYVPGTVGRLSKVAEINRYFRAVAAASPRVKVFSLGMSEEGREMLVAAVADSATIARLGDYRAMAGRLADPRGLGDAERARLVREAKPIYWLTGSTHSPETGSPEMLMELVYRLAAGESPNVRRIRDGVITLITPVTETDGRDRAVDAYALDRRLKLGRGGVPLVYWGKYIAHDNNRDGLVLSLKLSQHVNDGGLYWHPTVLHDLHESVPTASTSCSSRTPTARPRSSSTAARWSARRSRGAAPRRRRASRARPTRPTTCGRGWATRAWPRSATSSSAGACWSPRATRRASRSRWASTRR